MILLDNAAHYVKYAKYAALICHLDITRIYEPRRRNFINVLSGV